MLDKEVLGILSLKYEFPIECIDLANKPPSYRLLGSLAEKIPQWHLNLMDARFLDHSIKDAEKEYMMLDGPAKIKFLAHNPWTIKTPIFICDDTAFQFSELEDAENWLERQRMLEEEFF